MPPPPLPVITSNFDPPRSRPICFNAAYLSHADLFSKFHYPNRPSAKDVAILQNPISATSAPQNCSGVPEISLPGSSNPIPPLKTFASVVQDHPVIYPPRTSIPGSYHAVKINSDLYHKRLAICQFSLIGRVVLNKGDTPWKLANLRDRLAAIWNLSSQWRLISLGKGYFHILLTSKSEKDVVWGRGSLSLKPRVLCLQRWVPGFDPSKEKTTNTQVWVRFFRLPWELWDAQILADIA